MSICDNEITAVKQETNPHMYCHMYKLKVPVMLFFYYPHILQFYFVIFSHTTMKFNKDMNS